MFEQRPVNYFFTHVLTVFSIGDSRLLLCGICILFLSPFPTSCYNDCSSEGISGAAH